MSNEISYEYEDLTPEAQIERDEFIEKYGDGGCSCHIRPPCNWCVHPGNPLNQEQDDACWIKSDKEGGAE